MMPKSAKIAILGANGYIGRHLSRHLLGLGMSVDAFDVQPESRIESVRYETCDICDPGFWSRFMPQEYAAIFFLAGLSGVERSFREAETFLRVNIGGLAALLRRLEESGEDAPRLIFPSSRLVYDGGCAVDESSLRRSRSVYAASKVACEELLSAYHDRFGVPYVVLRICVPFGDVSDSGYSYGTIGFFMSNGREGKPITVYGDGSCRKTYTSIDDVCEIAARCIDASVPSGVYNVGGHEYTLREVAEMICARTGATWVSVPFPESARRVEMGNIAMDSGKLDAIIGKTEYRRLSDSIDAI